MSSSHPDVIVIGAGIAGASVACELALTHSIVVLEREPTPGYHSTGRSAALFSETYGNGPVRALSRASRNFFFSPPAEFSDSPLVMQRGSLHVARADQADALAAFLATADIGAAIRRLEPLEALAHCPVLRPESAAAGAAYEENSSDVDVHALHRGYLRALRRRSGALITNAEVRSLEQTQGRWRLNTTAGEFEASIVINAAGAWADEIAARASLPPVAIQPCRRTAALIELPSGTQSHSWPMTIAMDESFYFKPDAGLLLISPADETATAPCDAQPDDLDVAIAVDRIEQATLLKIERVRSKWAGLRSFAPDRSPVIGFDTHHAGFFWLAGQGGYGIQTAPGAAALSASLIRGVGLPPLLPDFDPAWVAPGRFAGRAIRRAQ